MEKKYTYNDWLNGHVQLDTCRLSYTKDLPKPIVVSLENFTKIDQAKIRDRQEEIFNQVIFDEVFKYKSRIKKQLKNSKFPELLIDSELPKFLELSSKKFELQNGTYRGKQSNLEYEEWYYNAMHEHIQNSLIRGKNTAEENVHSPKSLYRDPNILPPEVNIEVIFRIINYLNSLKKELKVTKQKRKSSLQKESIDTPPAFSAEEDFLKNHFECIRDIKSYNFFLRLIKELPSSRHTGDEKFSYVFHKLKSKRIIKKHVKHLQFIEYLNTFHSADIKGKKFRELRPSQRNEIIFNLLWAEFKKI